MNKTEYEMQAEIRELRELVRDLTSLLVSLPGTNKHYEALNPLLDRAKEMGL